MIFVSGDTHSDSDIHKLGSEKLQHLTKSDYIVILGDFGLIFESNKESSKEKYWLDWLNQKAFTTLFIDGNHENFDRLLNCPTQDFFSGKASRIAETVWYLRRGEIYEIDGCKFFCFGGASSVDRKLRMPGITWWPQEIPSEAELQHAMENLERHDWDVDYVFTHTCPESIRRIIPQLPVNDHIPAVMPYKGPDAVNEMLEIIRGKLSFKRWYFGHFHMDMDFDLDSISAGGVNQHFTTLYNQIRRVGICSVPIR
jgi:hypothetical protein